MARNWAIVIGINQYRFLQPLNYAKRDAEAMHSFLTQEAKFDRIFLFTDDSPAINGKATEPFRANLLRVLRQIFAAPFMKDGDNFWFFFSGHGIPHNGQDYLMPLDGDPEDIENTGISTNTITNYLRSCGADNAVMILDACRSGGKKSGEGIGRQTEAEARQTGVISFFSCSPDQYSYELEAIGQGAFTYALIEGLGVQGRCATVDQLNQYLKCRVPELVSQHFQRVRQTPYTIAEPLERSHLILMPQHANLADIATVKIDAYSAQTDEDWDLAERLWIRVLAAASGQDADAVRALQKIAIKRHTETFPLQLEQYGTSKSPKSSQKPTTQTPKNILEQSTSRTPVVPVQILKRSEQKRVFQIPELIASNLQEFTFEIVEVDSYGKITSRHAGENQFITEKVNEVAIEMVVVPGGTFLMGSPDSEGKKYKNERPQHTVTVQTILMSKYPITFSQWKAVALLQTVHRELKRRPSARNWGAKRPVVEVSWHDATEFCDRLSKETGHTYRLPTEAEWEYACRAGTTTPFHFGQTITSDLANYDGTYIYHSEPKGDNRARTLQVGELKFPNAFGLFDMHGNVWEWCQDHWHENYNGAPMNGEAWIDSINNQDRVIRGGSWVNEPSNCRSSHRHWKSSEQTSGHIGFRIVRSL